jgi:hypothetical protein
MTALKYLFLYSNPIIPEIFSGKYEAHPTLNTVCSISVARRGVWEFLIRRLREASTHQPLDFFLGQILARALHQTVTFKRLEH